MSQAYWSPLVKTLVPYIPGEQPKVANLIKLNTNENPYPPSPLALQAMQQAVGEGLRLYPDPDASALKQAIADYYGVERQQVFVGNGSDEVLAHAFMAFFKQDQPILFPDISYSFYKVYAGLYEVDYQTVPLNEQFQIAVDDYQQPNGGIIFPNPNAPTACLLPLVAIEQVLKANPDRVVIIDEAYIDFGGQTAISLVNQYPQLLVVQTLSKSRSLAGLRVGLAVGQAHLIEALERVKNSFNSYPMDKVAIAGAVAAFEDKAYFQQTCQAIIDSRIWLTSQLEQMGFEVLPSAANFIFARHPQHDATQLALALREQAIIVRHFKQPRIEQFLRITIGKEEDNQALVKVLQKILS
ncbi:MAG TPA: histidinol-phosphate transaminase [Agitococcus sp.]|nr:histidinol-phosphate transaminase [Agitococcus sp.]HNC86710.1 histidinol-phosphate transaminase [Agitococcus sp.]HNI64000.1 histidinol-phosphate transaminase [Agitococcus sp.]HNP01967.1 histidinol-phosphate transaminase [Agitococcus sp.]